MRQYPHPFRVDGYRVLSGVNTSVRILRICSVTVQTLGEYTLHKEILKTKLAAWSNALHLNEDYAKRNGILTTKEGKPTKAFGHYLSFGASMKWISIQGDAIRNSRLGFLLNHLIKETPTTDVALSAAEKLFYLHQLFKNDGDTLITLLALILEGASSKADLQERFETAQAERWKQKQRFANDLSKLLIQDADREIRAKPKRLKDEKLRHKHLVPTRLAWLEDLGALSPNRLETTQEGNCFFKSLPMLEGCALREINQSWIEREATTAFCCLILPSTPFQLWNDLTTETKADLLLPLLKNADALFGNDGAMRLPFYATLLYISISLAAQHHIIAELADLESTLENNFLLGGRAYSARRAARENESYITYNLR